MCMIDDADMAQVYDSQHLTARKAHTCDECGREIGPGERYNRVRGLWDGHWSVFKTCAHCDALWHWFDVVCGGTLHGGMGADLQDHWGEYGQPNLGRLLVMMNDKWRGRDVEQVRDLAGSNRLYRDVRAARAA